MVSFVRALNNYCGEAEDWIAMKDLENYKFHTLKVIEPSKLHKGEKLLETVISNMYSEINHILNSNDIPIDEMRKILTVFEEAYSALKVRYTDRKDLFSSDQNMSISLECLDKIATGGNIKNKFDKLVKAFLEFKNKHSKKKCNQNDDACNNKQSFLIIPIDDLDMNTDNCFEMAEEIRKYFVSSYVIVVMAIRTNQFTQVVQQEYLESFKLLYEKGMLDDSVADMAIKYVMKLIPIDRRNALPELSLYSLSNTYVKAKESDPQPIVDYFLGEIYRKTGLMLLKNNAGSHEIIPTNLRHIHFLYNLLKDMNSVDIYDCRKDYIEFFVSKNNVDNLDLDKEINILQAIAKNISENFLDIAEDDKITISNLIDETKIKENIKDKNSFYIWAEKLNKIEIVLLSKNKIKAEESRNILKRNLEIFEDYFYNYYIKSDIPKLYTDILSELMKQDNEAMNKYLVNELVNRGEMEKANMIETISSPSVLPQDISIGDVLFILRQVNIQKSDYDTIKLVEGIKIIYSLRMLKLMFIDNNDSTARKILGDLLYNTDKIKLMSLGRDNYVDFNFKGKSFENQFWFESIVRYYSKDERAEELAIVYDAKYQIEKQNSTKFCCVNFTSFITNLLDCKTMKERNSDLIIDKKDNLEIQYFKREYVAALPVWSLDFISYFFKNIRRSYDLMVKTKINNEHEHIIAFFAGCENLISKIIENNRFSCDIKLKQAFEKKPVINKNIIKNNLKDYFDTILNDYITSIQKKTDDNETNYNNTIPQIVKILGNDEEDFENKWFNVVTRTVEKLYKINPQKVTKDLNDIDNDFKISNKSANTNFTGYNTHELNDSATMICVKKRIGGNRCVNFCKKAIKKFSLSDDSFEIISINRSEK